MHKKRLIGFILSLILTMAAYAIIVNPTWFHFTNSMAIKAILGLAFAQATVQVFFFLDLWNEKGPLWNLNVFLSTLSIIAIIVWFSIWIIDNLNSRMM